MPILGGTQVIGTVNAYYVAPPKRAATHEATTRVQGMVLESWARGAKSEHDAPFLSVLEVARAALDADWIEFMEVVSEKAALRLCCVAGGGVWMNEPRPRIDVADYADVREALAMQRPLNHFEGESRLPPGVRMLLSKTSSRALLPSSAQPPSCSFSFPSS